MAPAAALSFAVSVLFPRHQSTLTIQSCSADSIHLVSTFLSKGVTAKNLCVHSRRASHIRAHQPDHQNEDGGEWTPFIPVLSPIANGSVQFNQTNAFLESADVATGSSSGSGGTGERGIGKGGGSGGGNTGGEGQADQGPSDAELGAVLAMYGRSLETLSPELRTLSANQLREYLRASQNALVRFLCRTIPSWRRRVAADPTFPFKLLMEETVGLSLAASGMIAARGKNLWKELDLVFCDIAVGATLNFILVWLLSPVLPPLGSVASLKARQSSPMGGLASLPANIFAHGNYGPLERSAGFIYKGVLFALCGFGGSLVGTTLSQGLLKLRSLIGADADMNKELPNVVVNSFAWAAFMFFSSNPRYQALAGAERLLWSYTPEGVAKFGCGAARTVNNIAGGAHWVWFAKIFGLKSSTSKLEGELRE